MGAGASAAAAHRDEQDAQGISMGLLHRALAFLPQKVQLEGASQVKKKKVRRVAVDPRKQAKGMKKALGEFGAN